MRHHQPLRLSASPPEAPDKATEIALGLIKKWEGFRKNAYQDTGGVWTIGYGHTGGVKEGDYVSEERAEEMLLKDMRTAALGVAKLERSIPGMLTPHQRGALISFTYNVGVSAMLKSNSVAGRLRAGDVVGAADGLLLWVNDNGVRIRGLANRRANERDVFLTGIAEGDRPEVGAHVTPEQPSTEGPLIGRSSEVPIAAGGGAATIGAAATVAEKAADMAPLTQYILAACFALVIGFFGYWAVRRYQKHRRAEVG